MNPKKIAIVGKGNVASHLVKWIELAGHEISSIYSRDSKDVIRESLMRESLDYYNEHPDFIIIATNDDSIKQIVKNLQNIDKAIILHTSGTVSMEVFSDYHFKQYGVLYPLQTLQKGRAIDLKNVPFLIEGNDDSVLQKIRDFCVSCHINCKSVSSSDRLLYHLSAVISSNFTNHLIHIAEENLKNSNLNIDILRPLIEETIAKAFENGAYNSQTGPAKRRDFDTMSKHLELLNQKNYQDIYRLISESIHSEYHQNK